MVRISLPDPNGITSVSNPYSLNADPAENLNPDPDPSCFLTLPEFTVIFFVIMLNHQRKSIERYLGTSFNWLILTSTIKPPLKC